MKALNQKAKLLGISMAAAGLFAMGSAAQAASVVQGAISFEGTVKVQDSGGNDLVGNKLTGAQIIFISAKTGNGTQSGDFTSVGDGTAVTFLSPFVYAPVSPPANNLWQVGGFSFNLTSWTFTNSMKTIAVDGYGTVSGNGFDPNTNVAFDLSTQAGGIAKVTFSASAAAPVPVPAALFFAAPALLGVFGVSRRKNAAGSAA